MVFGHEYLGSRLSGNDLAEWHSIVMEQDLQDLSFSLAPQEDSADPFTQPDIVANVPLPDLF